MAKQVIFIHGVAEDSIKMSNSFKKSMLKEAAHFKLNIHIVKWNQLAEKRETAIKQASGRLIFSRFLSFNLKESVETFLIARLRPLVIRFLGDAIYYMSKNSGKVKENLANAILDAGNDKDAEITVVSHSLGSVIAFDLLADRKFLAKLRKRKVKIKTLVTVGSPLALFSIRSDRPVRNLRSVGNWLNIYDNRDLIASKLSPFIDNCQDKEIKLYRANPITAHIKYFYDDNVLREILKII